MVTTRQIVNSTKSIASAALNRRPHAPDVQKQVLSKLVYESESSFPKNRAEKKLDLTSNILFHNTLPESVKNAVIQQMVDPRSGEAIEHNLKEKFAEVSQGRYKIFDFFESPKDALDSAIRQIKNSSGRTKVFYALGTSHDMSTNANVKSFLAEVDSWDESLLLGALHQKLSNNHPHTIAALILSPLTPTNGFQAYSKDFVLGVQDLCQRYGIQLVVDETSIGLGRTGPAFAFSSYQDLKPDVLITSVPSADFLPVTLVCSNNNHSGADMINPMSLASADASIKFFMDNNLPERTAEKSTLLKQELKSELGRSWSHGLCGGIELPGPLSTKAMLAENNIRVNSMRGGVSFQLPLLTSEEDIMHASSMIRLFSKLKQKSPWDASLPLA